MEVSRDIGQHFKIKPEHFIRQDRFEPHMPGRMVICARDILNRKCMDFGSPTTFHDEFRSRCSPKMEISIRIT